MKPFRAGLLALAILLLSCPASFANQGVDSAQGSDLPFSVSGTLVMTFCGGGTGTSCPAGYGGRIVFGPSASAPKAWINPATGDSSLGTPSGAVMAFNMDACPEGWSLLPAAAGRVIAGVGNSGTTGATTLTRGATGGEAAHTLTTDEMPSHSHMIFSSQANSGTNSVTSGNYASYNGFCNGCNERYIIVGVGGVPNIGISGSTGSNDPHNVMNPYLSLLYCQKD